ncbi:GPI mannosyltransferase 2-like [Uloborus diversus]|uniref:GPI mannosyltransferase 2-like n=1 Tax=Uloborus diversus TaxID=327109 RepID=UPI002409914E|nr:GPI mannosyltransferase 2-like [Uloborus diversus]
MFILLLQAFFNVCIPDHKADAFRLPFVEEAGLGNVFITYLLSGFSRWDAQYFLHIALYGYTHENTLAFFPLFPISLRGTTKIISTSFLGILDELNCALISGVFINSIFFALSAVFLYKLTNCIFQSEILALSSALTYCFNPASIFFSALYSESLFACLTFGGLWALERGNHFTGVIALSLSAAVRSNGVMSFGFVGYLLLKLHFKYRYKFTHYYSPDFIHILKTILVISIYAVIFIIPFASYQLYCYLLFCTSYLPESDMPEVVADFVTKYDLKLPSDPSKWCSWNIPMSYSYIQSRYWDVGFLNYYVVKQVPNFLLAAPIFTIIILSFVKYFKQNKSALWHLGLLPNQYDDVSDIYNCSRCCPYFLHIFFVTLFCAVFIHIQVLTRLLCSSSPVLYWIAATALLPSNDRARFKLLKESFFQGWFIDTLRFIKKLFYRSSVYGKIISCYFISYFFVGTFLHVNFFPWT